MTLELYRLFFGGCISPYITWEFSEGRKSMATQWTHRELAPRYAAGKVPVPWGRECHWGDRKTATLEPSAKHMWSCGSGVSVLCSSKVMPMSVLQERQPNGAHSFYASMPSSNRCLAEAHFKFLVRVWWSAVLPMYLGNVGSLIDQRLSHSWTGGFIYFCKCVLVLAHIIP